VFGAKLKFCIFFQYHIKQEMSICFLVNWLLVNLPRLHLLLHKYVIYSLTTGYTQLSTGSATIHTLSGGITLPPRGPKSESDKDKSEVTRESQNRLDPVLIWLLKSSLPPKFLTIFNKRPGTQHQLHHQIHPNSPNLDLAQLLLQLVRR
jgi:hypothetical protein